MPVRYLMLCLGIILLSACKIEIPSVAGGVVESDSGTYQCLPGNSCIIDVSDTEFDETFRAVPYEGYAFRGWNKGLCGGGKEPCALYTTSFDGNPSLLALLYSDKSFSLSPHFEYVGDDSGQQAFLIDEDNSGISNMILHPEGASLTVAEGESGDIWSELRFVDGEFALLRSDANGVPLELYYGDTVLVFLEFSNQQAKVGLILGDGSMFLATLALDDETVALLPRGIKVSTINTVSNAAPPMRSKSSTSIQTNAKVQADTTERTTTASEWTINAGDAWTIAAQVVGNRSLSPLFTALTDDLKKRIIDGIKKELTDRPQNTTTARLQTSIMINGGQCAVTIGTGGAVALLTSADACKELTRGAFQLTQEWAIKIRSDIGIDRLEAQGVAIKPNDLTLEVTNRLTTRDEAIAKYEPELIFVSPRASASFVGPNPTIKVKVRDALNPLTIDELSLYVDDKIANDHLFGIPSGDAKKVRRSTADDPSPLEGNNDFYLKGLAAGEHKLTLRAAIRGSAPQYDQVRFKTITFTVCEYGANESGTDCMDESVPEFAGTYSITSVDMGCDEDGYTENGVIALTQSSNPDKYHVDWGGNDIVFVRSGDSLKAESQSASYREDDGTTSETFNLLISPDLSLSGSSTWTWTSTDGTDTCSGGATFTGRRIGE
jgi:hypothetical protein